MTTTIPQLVLAGIAFVLMGARLLRFIRREKTQTIFKVATYVGVWGAIAYTSLFPWQVSALSRSLGFGENLNTLIFMGFVAVFFILFRLMAMQERTEKTLTELVRKEALKDLLLHHTS